MKEQLYTIPLTDAFQARDECPFCFVQRSLEQHSIDFVLGSGASYMEDDVRAETDKMGFCARHYEKMFIYGNKLGNSLILETHIKKLSNDLKNWPVLSQKQSLPCFPVFPKTTAQTPLPTIP